MSQKTRSSLKLDAVAQAAALGSANMLNPLKKLATIGALAGFVLRLFRSKEPAACKRPVWILYGSCKAAVRQPTGSPAGNKGGLRHG